MYDNPININPDFKTTSMIKILFYFPATSKLQYLKIIYPKAIHISIADESPQRQHGYESFLGMSSFLPS